MYYYLIKYTDLAGAKGFVHYKDSERVMCFSCFVAAGKALSKLKGFTPDGDPIRFASVVPMDVSKFL